MEISRLIFITLLITCSVVSGYNDCEEETISKLPDDQCLSDLGESELVITTATAETKNLDHFESKTTTSTILDKIIETTHNGHSTEQYYVVSLDYLEIQGRDDDITGNSNRITTTETSSLKRSYTEEDIHEEDTTQPITEKSTTTEYYTTTENFEKSTSELHSNENLLFNKINTESLNYFRSKSNDDSQESLTESSNPRIMDTEYQIILDNQDERTRLESIDTTTIIKQVEGIHETITSVSDDELEKSIQQNDFKVIGSIHNASAEQSPNSDFVKSENHLFHYVAPIEVYEDIESDLLLGDSDDDRKNESIDNGTAMNSEVFLRHSSNNQSNYSTNEPPKASELSSKHIEHVMLNDDEFMRNEPIKQLQNQKEEEVGCSGCDLGILPVTGSASGSKGKIENSAFRQAHAIPEASIQFADVPPEKDLRVDDLGLAEGSFLFGYLGELLSWLQPNDFPVELMRNALRNQISVIDLITQSLKLEAGFIGCIAIGVSLALAAPVVVLAHTCYRIRRNGDDGDQTPIGCAGNCRRRTLVFFLQIIIFLLLIGTAAMLITNQQVSTAVLQTSDVLKTVLDDLGTFLQNVHHQLHFAVSKHLDQAVQAVNNDLDNVEVLLGQPIQIELSRETGLDVALESLRDIAQDVSKVGESVELVQLAAGLLSEGVIMTTDKLSDLRLQVNSFRRQCSPRDRPLCDTLNIAGLEVTLRVDSLRQDDKLNRVRQIGGPELRGAVESARVLFRDIPRQVAVDTKDSREAVRRQLNQEQMSIDENIRSLEILVRNLKGKLTTGQNMLDDFAVDIPELEFWRWMIGLGAAGSLALLWILLQLGISCGCCGSEKSAGPTLLICVILICLLSTILWLLALIVFVIGGHGQAFICRPLYQEPEFPALSQLLDNPGLFPNSHKFISTLAFDNGTIDVPFNKVLRECHENKPVYPVFKLNGVFNIETMTESKKWDKFHSKLDDIKVKLNHLKVLSPTLQNQLNDLLQGLSVNLTAHRTYLSSQVTGKDLNSFAAQLESVGNQIKDLATASRMETLASRTRRLIATHIEPLKEKKNNLLYQLTTLEVQLNPLQRQVEQSISHFKTIQFFIDNQGNSIANKKVKEYTRRLKIYIDQYTSNLADRINNNLARCQPLWKLFNTSRLMLCKHVMDPLNGFWFATVCCLIILLCATPVCLKLVDCYKKKSQVSNYNSSSPTENLMSNEQGRDWSSTNGTTDSGGGW